MALSIGLSQMLCFYVYILMSEIDQLLLVNVTSGAAQTHSTLGHSVPTSVSDAEHQNSEYWGNQHQALINITVQTFFSITAGMQGHKIETLSQKDVILSKSNNLKLNFPLFVPFITSNWYQLLLGLLELFKILFYIFKYFLHL